MNINSMKLFLIIRPMKYATGSVTYKLSKYIVAILKELNGTITDSYISNADDFLNKVRNVDLHNKTMVSFDVCSLFTNAPLDDTMKFLKYHLLNNNKDMPFNNYDVLLKLVKLCTDNYYFSCNGQFVRQIGGIPMGSPLSPVLR